MAPEYEVAMTFSNERETVISLVIEPWGESFPLEAHAQVAVRFRSFVAPLAAQAIEVQYGQDRMVVYAWEGCTFALFQNGEELGAGAFSRPCVPQGLEILKRLGFFQEAMHEGVARQKEQDGG